MLRNEADRLIQVVVCSPDTEYFNISNCEEHNIQELADPDKTIQQHNDLRLKLEAFGSQVINIKELMGHPNSVFTRDTALCTPEGYIKLRLGLVTRQGEDKWMSQALDSLGEPYVGEIKAPGTVEGGDIVLADSVAFIGQSIRTNHEGIQQLSSYLKPMNYEIRTIPLPESILHLDKVLMTVNPHLLLYSDGYIEEDALKGFDTVKISYGENSTANIICLGNNEVIADSSNREAIEQLEAKDIMVHTIDLSEFAKGTGGPNCLILPVERN